MGPMRTMVARRLVTANVSREAIMAEYDGASGWEWTQLRFLLAGAGQHELADWCSERAIAAYEAEDLASEEADAAERWCGERLAAGELLADGDVS